MFQLSEFLFVLQIFELNSFLHCFLLTPLFCASFRNVLRTANEKLSQVLVDVLKTTAAAEETMSLHMKSLRDASSEGQQASLLLSSAQRADRPQAAGQ